VLSSLAVLSFEEVRELRCGFAPPSGKIMLTTFTSS
jgi:hypothetical protein